MSGVPLIIVVGGDSLAIRVCEDLCGTQGHRVALLWMHDGAIEATAQRLGAAFIAFAPNDYAALRAAGVPHATSIMVLSEDDRLNLQVALKARDLNPEIRIVIRQFNRTLGRKIEQNLPNCSFLSLSGHAAATFTAAALDRACFYALEFPGDVEGEIVGFSQRPAATFRVAGLTVGQAQTRLGCRIIGIGGRATFERDRRLAAEDDLVVFGRIGHLEDTAPEAVAERIEERERPRPSLGARVAAARRRYRRVDPIIKRIAFTALAGYAFAVAFFAAVLHRDVLTAAYFVNATVTTVGYGDITPLEAGPLAKVVASLVMFGGVAASGIFIAFVTAALTRAQWTAMQGLRRVRGRGHVVVCGAGNVGTRVIEYLLREHKTLVVIDPSPNAALIEASRNRHVQLLTGDATSDVTLDLCNLGSARALVALTDSDTANLEVTLGARARNPHLPVVMRVQDEHFAVSVARQFGITTTFSTSALSAPAFAGLSRFPGSRGRIAFGDDEYNIGERLQGEVPAPPPAEHCIPLGVWRADRFVHIDAFGEMEPYDRLLFIVPLSQFRLTHPLADPAVAGSAAPVTLDTPASPVAP